MAPCSSLGVLRESPGIGSRQAVGCCAEPETSVATLSMGVAVIDMDGRVSLGGQLERSPDGRLWVVLYRGSAVVRKKRVRSRRRGRRWLIDMVLTDAERYRTTGLNRPLDNCVVHRPDPPAAEGGCRHHADLDDVTMNKLPVQPE